VPSRTNRCSQETVRSPRGQFLPSLKEGVSLTERRKRHLYEGRHSALGGLCSRSLCGKRYYGRHPLAITRLQDPAAAVCPACAAVQERRLVRAWKAKAKEPTETS